MSATEYPEIDFKEIKRWLYYGDVKQLAVNHNITPKYAGQVLLGRRKNMELLKSAHELALKRKAEFVAMNEQIRKQ